MVLAAQNTLHPITHPKTPASPVPVCYPTPVSSKQEQVTQIALTVIAALLACLAIATTVGIFVWGTPVVLGAVTATALALAATCLFCLAFNTRVVEAVPMNLIKGPYEGLYERDFWAAVNYPHGLNRKIGPDSLPHQDAENWKKADRLYTQFIQRLEQASKAPSLAEQPPQIPHTIHFIWIGPRAVPESVKKVMASWEKFHPNWQIKLWRNEEAQNLIDEMSKLFPKVLETWNQAKSWAEKADILRYCALYKEGGFYADTDLPCTGSIQELHQFSEFFSGIETAGSDSIFCGNSAIGSRPNHPILKYALENLTPRPSIESSPLDIVWRTGPELLSKSIRHSLQNNSAGEAVVLPPPYFYPAPMFRSPFVLLDKGIISLEEAGNYKTAISKGVHLWDSSWHPAWYVFVWDCIAGFFFTLFQDLKKTWADCFA